MEDFDQQELCLQHETFNFQLKSRYLSFALRYAVKDMPSKTWLGCYSETIDSIFRMDGVAHVKNKETVLSWHLAFRSNNEAFPNPHVMGTQTSLPPLLDQNSELLKDASLNMPSRPLSAKIIYSYLHEGVALPALLKERRAELAKPIFIRTQLLGENQLTKLSITNYSGGWVALDSSRHTLKDILSQRT
jgi:hypothetical protein